MPGEGALEATEGELIGTKGSPSNQAQQVATKWLWKITQNFNLQNSNFRSASKIGRSYHDEKNGQEKVIDSKEKYD